MLFEMQNWFKEMKDKIVNLFLEEIRIFPPHVEPCLFETIAFQRTNTNSSLDYTIRKIFPDPLQENKSTTPKFSEWMLTQMLKEFRDIYLENGSYALAVKKFNKFHEGYSEELIYDAIAQYEDIRKKHSPEYVSLHLPNIFPFEELGEREFPKLERAVFLYSKLLSSYNGVNQNGENPFESPKGRAYNDLAKIAEYTGIDASKIQDITKKLENNIKVQKYRHEQFGFKADEVSEHDLVNIYLEKESGATYEEIIKRYHLASMYSARKTYRKGKEAYEKLTLK